jgi:hypothetical protein
MSNIEGHVTVKGWPSVPNFMLSYFPTTHIEVKLK